MSDFKQLAKLEVDGSLEIKTSRNVKGGLFMIGGLDKIHIVEFDQKSNSFQLQKENVFATTDLIQRIIRREDKMYPVTMRGRVSVINCDFK